MKYEITVRRYAIDEIQWIAAVDEVDRHSGEVVAQFTTEAFATVDACLHSAAQWIAEQERKS